MSNLSNLALLAGRPQFGLCRNPQHGSWQSMTGIRVLPEEINKDGSVSSASFSNSRKPAMPKSALPMRRTAKTAVIWLPKLHLLLVASEFVKQVQPAFSSTR
jgi:hypothetical protein